MGKLICHNLVSAVWYERQRSRYPSHWLLHLEQVADLTPLEQGCAGFHANSGWGFSYKMKSASRLEIGVHCTLATNNNQEAGR